MATGSPADEDADHGADAEGSGERALPLGPQQLPDMVELRRIEDAETLKALADPLRLRIMRVMSRGARAQPRIMTVKQLAEELGEPTTKLYRHMKQLLAVDLIQVAELRLVGGIVEQQYRVAQVAFVVRAGDYESPTGAALPEEVFGVVGAAVLDYFERYEAALREGRTHLRSEENLTNPPYVRSIGVITDVRVPPERAAEFGERLHALVEEFTAQPDARDDDPDAVSVNLMAMYYGTETRL